MILKFKYCLQRKTLFTRNTLRAAGGVELEVFGVSAPDDEQVEVVVASDVPGVGGGGPGALVLLGALPGHPIDGVPAGVGARARLGGGGCKHEITLDNCSNLSCHGVKLTDQRDEGQLEGVEVVGMTGFVGRRREIARLLQLNHVAVASVEHHAHVARFTETDN